MHHAADDSNDQDIGEKLHSNFNYRSDAFANSRLVCDVSHFFIMTSTLMNTIDYIMSTTNWNPVES